VSGGRQARRGRGFEALRRILDASTRTPGRAAFICLVAVALCALGIVRLDLRVDPGVLGSDPRGAAQTLAEIERTFVTDAAFDEGLTVLIEHGGAGSAGPGRRTPPMVDDIDAERELDRVAAALVESISTDSILLMHGVALRDVDAESTAIEEFVAAELAPRMVHLLDDDARERLAERLSPDGIAKQIGFVESMLLTPGPAGSELSRRIRDDPLELARFGERFGAGIARPTASDSSRRIAVSVLPGARMVHLSVAFPSSDSATAARVMSILERHASHAARAAHEGISVRIIGGHAIAAFAERTIRSEMIRGVLLSCLLVAIVQMIMFRRAAVAVVAAVPVACAILVAFGVLGWSVGAVSHLGTLAAAVLIGLTIDFAIHAVAAWTGESRRDGSAAHALRWSRAIRRALALAAVTSGIAFAALVGAGVPAVRDFGLVGMVGVVAAVPITLLLVPWMLGAGRVRPSTDHLATRRFVEAIGRRPRSIALAVVIAWLALLVCGVSSGRLGAADTNLESMHPSPNAPLRDRADLDRLLGHEGERMVILIESVDERRFVEAIREVDAILRSDAAADFGVRRIESVASLPSAPGEDDRWRRGALGALDPDEVEGTIRGVIDASILNSEHFVEYPRRVADLLRPPAPLRAVELAERLPPRARAIRTDDDAIRTIVAFDLVASGRDARTRRIEVETIRSWIAATPEARLASFGAVAVDLEDEARRDLVWLLAIAAGGIVVVMTIVIRPSIAALLAMLPAALATVGTFAAMALLGDGWNAITVAAPALAIGLGVDDGIFLAMALRRVRPGQSPLAVVTPTIHAIIATTATTIAAFGTLAMSSVPAISSLGVIVACASLIAMVCTVGLQLPLAILIHRGLRAGSVAGGADTRDGRD